MKGRCLTNFEVGEVPRSIIPVHHAPNIAGKRCVGHGYGPAVCADSASAVRVLAASAILQACQARSASPTGRKTG
jgi:hypothetical protein